MAVERAAAHGARGGVDPALLKAVSWRLIGPFRGGRVVAVAGDPVDPRVFYFGACAGGVWKTVDGGLTWENVSDGFFTSAAIGAIAVSESDPNVIYVGTGETTIRGNVVEGDGVYKSTDGGRTWQHLGLADTRAIGRIRIHPQNPDIVYVAALGHVFGPNEERGVFRSTDGGKTWEKVLFRSERAGAVDLSMDPSNPRILYASIWEAYRTPYSLVSGGPECGLFRSTDGGDTWEEITRNEGLPKGTIGKIGVSASGAKPGRVWALVEAEDGALFRSDDYGQTWQRLSESPSLRQRPWYYMHVFADPVDPETVYVLNLDMLRSTDGGQTFHGIPTPHGDNHDLWIDPKNPQRMINGNDGGACVSYNGGVSWSSIYNQPTAQFYHVTTDTREPYRVYGAQQDNTTISGPSRSDSGAITNGEWYPVGGGESGYIAVRPDDPNIVYAGSYGGHLTRYDHRTGQKRNIMVWPENHMGWAAKDLKYRFQWTFPIVISPHNPNVLYVCSNHVHRSTDEGSSWETISPDLTRNDTSKMGPSGGPITRDNTSVEYYGTVFAFAESPVQPGLLWAGSDDGLIHISRDGGQTWQNVTPPDLPEWALISIIEPSPHDPAVAYVAATRYKLDDRTPYLYKTQDYGQTWTRITDGIPEDDFTRVIREDPERPGLLYCGTESGLYVSFDDGGYWQSLRGDGTPGNGKSLPVVPIHDLAVKGSDLIAATHGRSFWVLDDLTPLRQMRAEIAEQEAHLFAPRPAIRYRGGLRNFLHPGVTGREYLSTGPEQVIQRREGKREEFLNAGANPPSGVVVTYWLKEKPEGEVTLTFLDADGNEIRTFTSEETGSEPKGDESEAKEHKPKKKEPRVPKEAGTNRFIWDLRYPDAHDTDPPAVLWAGTLRGPLAVPGQYQVRLTVNGQSYTQPFEVKVDPRVTVSQEDLQAQFDLLLKIRDKLSETHDAIMQIRNLRSQAREWQQRAQGSAEGEVIASAAESLIKALTEIEEELIQVKAKEIEDPLNFPVKLNNKLAALAAIVDSADAAPTRQSVETYEELTAAIDRQLERLAEIVERDVTALNAQIREAALPALAPKPREGR
ncbi:glycosyl hydrolase [Sphaerobacter sp.]|uniref:WD40/YVTN/BNR-like repeat-containing protein n=1 Tax=Sphaerobacter sp. TaxID=2099654 RepID=UPI001D50DEA6|nr:glycosyl hydrolase [Sphaerobacter sp.]MBX5446764.1 glycosyl hydrolase [Sphaerobacter sp.]